MVAMTRTAWRLPVSNRPAPTRTTRGPRFEPTQLSARASKEGRVQISSLSTLYKHARHRVNLGWPWRFDAAKIQGFLKQTEAAAQIRHGLHAARNTQPLKDSRIAFFLRQLKEAFQ